MNENRLLGELLMEVFRLNAVLTRAGDDLVAGLGLTSARWLVLGAVANAPTKQPVAHLARSLGQSRQGVQRTVNELVASGFVELIPNPHHQRARLVSITATGQEAYDKAMKLRLDMIDGVSEGIGVVALESAIKTLATIRSQIRN